MIVITYKRYDLTVIGHAGTAEYGKDLVCCAVSALTYALEAHLMRHEEYRAITTRNPIDAKFKASAHPKFLYDKACTECFETIVDGLRLLAKQYPEAITLIEGRD